MSDLIAKRLSTLQAGTRVSLTWPGGVSGYETAVGTVTENNQKDGIAIVTEDGEEVLVAYHAVYSLRIPKAASAVSQADAQVILLRIPLRVLPTSPLQIGVQGTSRSCVLPCRRNCPPPAIKN